MKTKNSNKAIAGICGMLLIANASTLQAAIVGEGFTAVNTFEDAVFTGGVETIFGFNDSATVTDPGVDIAGFVGFYDIDFTETSLTMTLIDNSGAATTNYAAGTFDRYYFGFDSDIITGVSLDGTDELNAAATVTMLAPGDLSFADLFATGISQPINLASGGFFVELGEGTDINTIGDQLTVNFTSAAAVPEPASVFLATLTAVGALAYKRRKSKANA